MEAAAIFVVAEYHNVTAGAVFTVSDRLRPDTWEPAFDETAVYLNQIFEYALDALEGWSGYQAVA